MNVQVAKEVAFGAAIAAVLSVVAFRCGELYERSKSDEPADLRTAERFPPRYAPGETPCESCIPPL